MKLKLKTLKQDELLGIGTEVTFHHRAGVARFKKKANPSTNEENKLGWVITDGVQGNEVFPSKPFDKNNWEITELKDGRTKYEFFDWPQARNSLNQKYNKTILTWPEDGCGWVMGIVRRSIGVSERGYMSSSTYYGPGEYEPGYHHSDMYVDLYVIKQSYIGTDYILCPVWAVMEIIDL